MEATLIFGIGGLVLGWTMDRLVAQYRDIFRRRRRDRELRRLRGD
jgi:hypothetical protein